MEDKMELFAVCMAMGGIGLLIGGVAAHAIRDPRNVAAARQMWTVYSANGADSNDRSASHPTPASGPSPADDPATQENTANGT